MVFTNKKDELFFLENGYVKVNLLNKDELNALRSLYERTKDLCEIESNFYTSIWSNNQQYKERVDSEIKEILGAAFDRYFINYRTVFGNFMVKKAKDNSSLQPHQDWTFVDEPKFYSITVWMPLVSVDKENGALEVLPKSQKMNNYSRARYLNGPFSLHNDYISQNLMRSIPLNEGEVLLVNSRTIHASPNNRSAKDRIAASLVVIPKEATLVHQVLDSEVIYKLHIDNSFFTKYSCFDKPNCDSFVTKLEVTQKDWSLEEIKSVCL